MKFYLLLLFVLAGLSVQSQSLTEMLGGITTAFNITSGDLYLNTEEQILIKRARGHSRIVAVCEGGAGYGYGYESMHLEFHSVQNIKTRHLKDPNRRRTEVYRVAFYDKNNELLAGIELGTHVIRRQANLSIPPRYTFSFDLQGVPLILLDRAVTIDIQKLIIR